MRSRFLHFFLLSAFLALPLFSFAQTSDSSSSDFIRELQKQIEELKKQVQVLQQQLVETRSELGVQPQVQTQLQPQTQEPQVSQNIQESAVAAEEAPVLPEFTRTLASGSSGDDVRKLQEFLAKDKDIYPEGLTTGFFGPLTVRALKKWQQRHDIEAVGILGPQTRARFRELGRGVIQGLLAQGAGASGVVPPGLLRAPGIRQLAEKKLDSPVTSVSVSATSAIPSISAITTSTPAAPVATTSAIATTTPSDAIPAAPATPASPAQPTSSTGVTTVSAASATPATPAVTTATSTTPDTTAPVVSSIQASNWTSTSFVITWVTNDSSDSQVEYGPTWSYGSSTVVNTAMVTSHSVTVSGLHPSTSYQINVKSRDAAGNLGTGTFATVTASVATTTATTTTTTTTTSGQMTVDVKVNDQDTISNLPYNSVMTASWTTSGASSCVRDGSVIPLVGGGNWEYSSVPFSGNVQLYARHANFGYAQINRLQLGVRCYGPQGPSGSSVYDSVSVPLVLSEDTTAPTTPTNLTATGFSNKISLVWSASTDNVGVAGYRVYRDGIPAVFATATSTAYVDINIAPVEVHTYTVAAYDAAGNASPQSNSASAVTLAATVAAAPSDTLGPWITSLSVSPTSGSPGTIIGFTTTAEDPSGLAYVIFSVKYPDGYTVQPKCNFNGATSGTCTVSQAVDIQKEPQQLGQYVIASIQAADSSGKIATYYPNGTVSNSNQSTHSLTIPSITISSPSTPPDLTISGFSTPLSARVGQAVTLVVAVRNAASGTAPASTLLVAFSKTSDFDVTTQFYKDVIPETRTTLSVPSIGLSGSASVNWSTTIPQTTQSSLYFVVKSDPDNQIVETSETDNSSGTQINITQSSGRAPAHTITLSQLAETLRALQLLLDTLKNSPPR